MTMEKEGAPAAESAEQFLFRSFRILDQGDYQGWLALCTEDVRYTVTTVDIVARKLQVPIIQDDFGRLKGRIQSIERFWHAEVPPTRTHHLVTNVETETRDGATFLRSSFLVVATRRKRQVMLTGRYRDELRPAQGSWRLAARVATLDTEFLADGQITFIV